jgi:hypothetical protein
MSALKSLTFTTLPKIGANPVLDRRTKLIARLEEQKLLLKDPNHTRTVRTWVKKDRQLMPVDKQQRVLPWWRVNANGSFVFFVRSGSKPIEFEKGKKRNCRSVARQGPHGHRHSDQCGAQRRT